MPVIGEPRTPALIEAREHEAGLVPVHVVPVPLPTVITPLFVIVVTAPFAEIEMPVPAATELVAVHVGIPASQPRTWPLVPPVRVRTDAEDPMTEMGCESVRTPEVVSVVVDVEPSRAGEPLVVVQYGICPAVSFVEVETACVLPTEFIVIGEEPRTLNEVQVVEPEQVTEVVAVLEIVELFTT